MLTWAEESSCFATEKPTGEGEGSVKSHRKPDTTGGNHVFVTFVSGKKLAYPRNRTCCDWRFVAVRPGENNMSREDLAEEREKSFQINNEWMNNNNEKSGA
ncbi:Hypothetical protein NTJ_08890 [Nesidiocoris tenuis]|nr:Hypothetical protein NTJ_08890 [Nesidiocoris tenuis]